MNNRPVAMVDSGIGGLPYLSWIQENLPDETLVYLADRKNFPYGEKSPEGVTEAILSAIACVVSLCDPKLLVVACNTASVVALDAIRRRYTFPVVGVVPAVKTAARLSRNKVIGVLATQRTISGPYLKNLIEEYAAQTRTVCLGASDIVTHVEEDYLNPNLADRQRILSSWARQLREQGVDTVVLGCTHFLHVTEDLRRELGEGIRIVDSLDGVGRRVGQILKDMDQLADGKASDRFYFTLDGAQAVQLPELEKKYRIFAERYRLAYGGALFS